MLVNQHYCKMPAKKSKIKPYLGIGHEDPWQKVHERVSGS